MELGYQKTIQLKMGKAIVGFESMKDHKGLYDINKSWEQALTEQFGRCPDPSQYCVSRMEKTAKTHPLDEKISVLFSEFKRQRKMISVMLMKKPTVPKRPKPSFSAVRPSTGAASTSQSMPPRQRKIASSTSKIKVAGSAPAVPTKVPRRATLFQDSATFVNTPCAYIQRLEPIEGTEQSPIIRQRLSRPKENQSPQSSKAQLLENIQRKSILKRQMDDSQRGEKKQRRQETGHQSSMQMQAPGVPLLNDVNQDLEGQAIEYRDARTLFLEKSKHFSNSHLLEIRHEFLKRKSSADYMKLMQVFPSSFLFLRELLDV